MCHLYVSWVDEYCVLVMCHIDEYEVQYSEEKKLPHLGR